MRGATMQTTAKLERSAEHGFIDEAQLKRALADPERITREIKRWNKDPEKYIEENFAKLVEYDFPVFAGANIRISSKKGRSDTLVLNRAQRALWRIFLEDIAAGRPVRWFILKSRQLGCSTFMLALIYWLTSQRPNRNALVATHDSASVTNFNHRFRSIHASCHPMLQSPTSTNFREGVVFGNNSRGNNRATGVGLDSHVIFATAARGELGRSYNFHYAFLSEFCLWPALSIDVGSQLAALSQTMPELPGTCLFIESTAKGENEATKFWHETENGFRKIFISWVADESYRRPARRPLGDLCASDEAGGKSTRYGNEREEARLIEDALRVWYPDEIAAGGDEWIKAEVEARLNWRRYTIDKKCNGDVNIFRYEYPTIPQHALSSTSKQVFDQHSLELMRAHVNEEAIQPSRFSYIHDPEETDPNVKFQPNPYGQLHIYKRPEAGQAYVIGADVAMGISNSGDPSALIVLSAPDLEEVASFCEIITPDRFAELLYYIGMIYNGALLGVEDNERGGFAANLKLAKELRYPRLFYRFDAFDKKAASRPGYHTTDTNKSVNVSVVQQLVKDHEILLRTPLLLDQLQHYMLLPNGMMGGAVGWKDDYVSALLIAVHLSSKVHQYPPKVELPGKGTVGWAFRKHAESRRPGLFGR